MKKIISVILAAVIAVSSLCMISVQAEEAKGAVAKSASEMTKIRAELLCRVTRQSVGDMGRPLSPALGGGRVG